jgi:hypothetical protein
MNKGRQSVHTNADDARHHAARDPVPPHTPSGGEGDPLWREQALAALQACPDSPSGWSAWLQTGSMARSRDLAHRIDDAALARLPKYGRQLLLRRQLEAFVVPTARETACVGLLIDAMRAALAGGEAKALVLESPNTMEVGRLLFPVVAHGLAELTHEAVGGLPMTLRAASGGPNRPLVKPAGMVPLAGPLRVMPLPLVGNFGAFLHRFSCELDLPVTPSARDALLERTLDSILAELERRHIVALVFAELSSAHMTPDVRLITTFLEGLRRRGIVVALLTTPAIVKLLPGTVEQLANLQWMHNTPALGEVATVAAAYWQIVDRQSAAPTVFRDAIVLLAAQRRWIPDLALAMRRQSSRVQPRLSPQELIEQAGCNCHESIRLWERYWRQSLSLEDRLLWADWVPRPLDTAKPTEAPSADE